MNRESAHSSDQLPAGTILFGEYEIVGVLGSGGMGVVYRANHRSLGGQRAIKVVKKGGAVSEEMFVREARGLIDLNHDGVVRCRDLLRDDHRLYLVMDLVEGPSLQRILLQGPLPDDEVRLLRKRMLEALAAIHAKGVVHRDISPANIILPNGAPEAATIIDFGVATNDAPEGKQESGFRGNPDFASPEQYQLFGGRVESRSDLYSLGLTLAAATIGEPLLGGGNYYERREARKTRPSLPSYISAALQAEILPLLEPDPRQRPASAADALRSVSVPLPPHHGGEDDDEDADDETTRSWLPAVLFTASAVGIGVGIGLTFWLWQHTNLLGAARPQSAPPAVIAQNVSPPPPSPPAKTIQVTQTTQAQPPPKIVNPQPPQVIGNPSPPPRVPEPLPRPVVKEPAPVADTKPNSAGGLTRAQILKTAETFVNHPWICGDRNRVAPCVRGAAPYRSDWDAFEPVRGIAYDWGGIDSPEDFDRKLSAGQAAGSHSRHGVTGCTAGVDCSGYVSFCWGHRGSHAYSTANMSGISVRPKKPFNVFTDLKPGDALNKPGSHIVLFAGYQPNGKPIVYEASGSHARVIRNDTSGWTRYRGYHPLQFKMVIDQ